MEDILRELKKIAKNTKARIKRIEQKLADKEKELEELDKIIEGGVNLQLKSKINEFKKKYKLD